MGRQFTQLSVLSAALLFSGAAWAGYGSKESGGGSTLIDPARGWDHLWREVIIDITVIGVAFALLTAYFIWKYRRRPGNETGHSPRLSTAAAVAWVVIPTFVFLSDDLFVAANGWQLWNAYRQVPADRLEVEMESGMYSWDYTYPNGVKAQNDLRVPAGKPVMLRMHSRDTLHSHFIPDFRVKEDSMPGRVTYLWFYPREPGKHLITCAEYCGVMHSYMVGQVIVMPPAEFQTWYEQEAARMGASKAAASAADTAAAG
ncbi:cytochrome c oxidase subunit II [Denitratisoma oestradiolicum]|uniref:Cytochrome aa3 subunit 2 n=1 Tax=Denitratisoma oestradiolicum TaxID=311182 RepID=A0A6S6XXA0_9PROT|nr:cytochrome c oxidase subunit II [Denitratisoma oestradiolicum]TWO81700.1 cytochrome c oxidase subunit II [Denitratisoma oestradiolicum]CAB1370649.1 Cytochrome c oxidase aa3, subunit II [Denitratisoma oestradiolicum]